MTTINNVGNSLSGNTGTGNFVGANSPTLITPILGVATATSVTFSPTTNGIVGTTTNDNAATGYVGEFITNSATGVSLTSGMPTNIVTQSLTAGDWDVWGTVGFVCAAGTLPTAFSVTLSSTSAGFAFPYVQILSSTNFDGSSTNAFNSPMYRFSLSTTTTIYLVAISNFTVSTMTGRGVINCRRAR